MKAADVQDGDFVFTFVDSDNGRVYIWNTSAIKRDIEADVLAHEDAQVSLVWQNYEHAVAQNGVERDHVNAIANDNERLAEPVIWCRWPDVATNDAPVLTLIDGSHRLVAIWERGIRVIVGYIVDVKDLVPYLIEDFSPDVRAMKTTEVIMENKTMRPRQYKVIGEK